MGLPVPPLAPRVIALAVLLLGAGAVQTPASAQARIPTPASVLGWEPGADRKLPTWTQVTDYFHALDKARL